MKKLAYTIIMAVSLVFTGCLNTEESGSSATAPGQSAFVSGKVALNGTAPQDVNVTLVNSDNTASGIPVTLDAAGNFNVEVPEGSYRLTIEANGSTSTKDIVVEVGKNQAIGEIEMPCGTSTVSGTAAGGCTPCGTNTFSGTAAGDCNLTDTHSDGDTPAGTDVGSDTPSGTDVEGDTPSGTTNGGGTATGTDVDGGTPSGTTNGGGTATGTDVDGGTPSGTTNGGGTPSGIDVDGGSEGGTASDIHYAQ